MICNTDKTGSAQVSYDRTSITSLGDIARPASVGDT